jgi:hypothetical protein
VVTTWILGVLGGLLIAELIDGYVVGDLMRSLVCGVLLVAIAGFTPTLAGMLPR